MCNNVISVTEYMTDRKRVNTPCFQKNGAFLFLCVLPCSTDSARGPPPSQCCLRYAPNAIYRGMVAEQQLYRLSDSLQYNTDASKFPTTVGKFTQRPSCTTPLCHWPFSSGA